MYDAGQDRLLLVATDRVSAFDRVFLTGFPKGAILTGISISGSKNWVLKIILLKLRFKILPL